MRKVNPADTVAHLWANQAQPEARTATRNFWYDGALIYSYSTPIGARLPDGRVLLADGRYSNTTAKHQAHLRRACSHLERIYMDHPDGRTLETAAAGDYARALSELSGQYHAALERITPKTRPDARPFHAAISDAAAARASFIALGGKAAGLPDTDGMTKEAALAILARRNADKKRAAGDASAKQAADCLGDMHAAVAAGDWLAVARRANDAGRYYDRALEHYDNVPGCKVKTAKTAKARAALSALADNYRPAVERAVWLDRLETLEAGIAQWRRNNAGAALYARRIAAGQTTYQAGRYCEQIKAYASPLPDRPHQFRSETTAARYADPIEAGAGTYARGHLERARALSACRDYRALVRRHAAVIKGQEAAEYISVARQAAAEYDASRSAILAGSITDEGKMTAPAVRLASAATHVTGFYPEAYAARILAPIADTIQAAAAWRAEYQAAAAAREAARLAGSIAAWRAGSNDRAGLHSIPPMLRLAADGKTIQTSHGASVPLSCAAPLWELVQQARAAGADISSDFGDVATVGSFRLTTVKADGGLVVGCHDIPAVEIDFIADCLGYDCSRAPAQVGNA